MCDVLAAAAATGAETGFTGKVDGQGSLLEQFKDTSLGQLSTTEQPPCCFPPSGLT